MNRRETAGRLRRAWASYRSGDLRGCEVACRRILAHAPDHGGALHLLGLLAHQTGHAAAAADLLRQAAEANPDDGTIHNSRGLVLRASGDLKGALAAFRDAVRCVPKDPAALANLASALLETGRLAEAEEICLRLIRLRPREPQGLGLLGAVREARGDTDGAIEAFERAAKVAPRDPATQLALARALRDAGRLAQAEAAAHNALSAAPRDPAALHGLGLICRDGGRVDDANRWFKEALTLDPDDGEALYQLCSTGREELDDGDLERIARRAQSDRLAPPQRISMHFALSAVFERRGDDAAAFRHGAQGNELRRQLLADQGVVFRPDEERNLTEALKQQFTRSFLEARRGFGVESTLPVFIVGMPRSGTSLVEQILASHPQVHGTGERRDMDRIAAGLAGRLGVSAVYPDCVAAMTEETAKALGEEYLAACRVAAPDAARITDKMPTNYQHLGLIALLLPGARVIHCRRDPRDTAVSCFLTHFTAPQPWSTRLEDIAQVLRCHEDLMTHWQSVQPLAVMEVGYEDIVADVEGTARALLDFLDLSWDDACLRFHANTRTVRTASAWQVRRPVQSGSVGRWRRFAPWLGPLLDELDGSYPQ